MKKLFERITNGDCVEPLIRNEKYELLFQYGVNVYQYHLYRVGVGGQIITVDVYPHEKVEILTFISWTSPEVEEVKEICKKLYRDLRIFLKSEITDKIKQLEGAVL